MAIHLRAARVNAGLTIAEAAKKANISYTTLFNYEHYRTVPDIKTAVELAKIYGTTVDDIIFFEC